MNPVLIDDLEARFRPLSDAEKITAQAWLDDAWEEVKARVPGVEQRLNDGTLSDGLVRKVISGMVRRLLLNPGGVRQWSVDNGDYSETRDTALSSGALYLSDDEMALLTGASSTRHRGAFSTAPAPVLPARSPNAEWLYGYAPGYLR